jgi:hypothetical protein
MEMLEMKHAFGRDRAVVVSGIRTCFLWTSNNVATRLLQAGLACGVAYHSNLASDHDDSARKQASHISPSGMSHLASCILPRVSPPPPFFSLSSRRSIAGTHWAGSRAPVHSLMAARGSRHLSLVLPTCIIVMVETLAEIRYHPSEGAKRIRRS